MLLNWLNMGSIKVNDLCSFFGKPLSLLNIVNFSPLVNLIILTVQYEVFEIALAFQTALAMKEARTGWSCWCFTMVVEKSKVTSNISFVPLLSKRKLRKFEKHIKPFEKEVKTLSKQQNHFYKIMMDKYVHNQISDCLSEVTLCLHFPALIPPSTAEVKWSLL